MARHATRVVRASSRSHRSLVRAGSRTLDADPLRPRSAEAHVGESGAEDAGPVAPPHDTGLLTGTSAGVEQGALLREASRRLSNQVAPTGALVPSTGSHALPPEVQAAVANRKSRGSRGLSVGLGMDRLEGSGELSREDESQSHSQSLSPRARRGRGWVPPWRGRRGATTKEGSGDGSGTEGNVGASGVRERARTTVELLETR